MTEPADGTSQHGSPQPAQDGTPQPAQDGTPQPAYDEIPQPPQDVTPNPPRHGTPHPPPDGTTHPVQDGAPWPTQQHEYRPGGYGDDGGQAGEQVNVVVTEPSPAPATQLAAQVKGRIDIEDEVVEKVAGLAATEVEGVADLGGDLARAVESVRERIGIGQRRGGQGVRARIDGRQVSIDVTIVVEYGHVVMEVARRVKTNVAIQTNRMLGLRVVEVNVVVDDVRMPQAPRMAEREDDDQRLTIG